jgi:hypothetical protein
MVVDAFDSEVRKPCSVELDEFRNPDIGVSSPRVPAAISNDVATRMAITSAAVTNAVGDFIIIRSRCGSSRLRKPNGLKKMGQAGN